MIDKQQVRILREVIVAINGVISKVHSTKMDFAKGSVEQRLVNDLDEARVTTRAIIRQKEPTNANSTHPQTQYTDG